MILQVSRSQVMFDILPYLAQHRRVREAMSRGFMLQVRRNPYRSFLLGIKTLVEPNRFLESPGSPPSVL